MKYLFSNVIFTPDEKVKLKVDGQVVQLSIRAVALLQYFLDTNEQISSPQQILDAVWGKGEYTFEAARTAIHRLNQKLPEDAQIENIRMEGYVLNVDLKKIAIKHQKTELIFEKSPFLKRATILSIASLFILSLVGLGAWAGVGKWLDPEPAYTVQNIKPIFTRDHLVGIPQLSPDGNFIAHRQSSGSFDNAYLAITDLQSGETQSLTNMRFTDGIKWSPSGDKIVYQFRDDESCEIRLLELNASKGVADNNLLTGCLPKSGVLSFAWFNEHEFYVNLVDSPTEKLSIHQLYSIDIRTKTPTKLLTADNKGVGFFSLEYDAAVDTLYMLMTSDFVTTEFYRYREGALDKFKTIPYPTWYYAAANNQLVYKNQRNDFVINQPAEDFADQKVLLPSTMEPVMKPHINGNKLTYLAGSTYGFELKTWDGEQLADVELERFKPSVLARYKGDLIFASDQTGINQLYLLNQENNVIRISNMTKNESIKHIEVAETAGIFAVSYRNKVDFYHYHQGEFEQLNSLPGYRDAYLSADGDKVLLSQLKNAEATGTVIEMRLSDLQPTGLEIHNTIMAIYYQGDVIYADKKHQLLRYDEYEPEVLATGINISTLRQTTLYDDKLYYIARQQNQRTLFTYDLVSSEQTQVHLPGADPTRIEVINGEIFIRTRQLLRPKIMVGELTTN